MRTGQRISFGLLLWALLAAASEPVPYPLFEERQLVASINREKLFNNSAYGSALRERLSREQSALVEENELLQNNLEREERELTELRKQIPAEEFEPLADAFDRKANDIRQTQAKKSADIATALESARFIFFRRTELIIKDLMAERGILYVLNEQAILISTGEGDITQTVMDRLDELYAEGVLRVPGD